MLALFARKLHGQKRVRNVQHFGNHCRRYSPKLEFLSMAVMLHTEETLSLHHNLPREQIGESTPLSLHELNGIGGVLKHGEVRKERRKKPQEL